MQKTETKYAPVDGVMKEGNYLKTSDGTYPLVKHPQNGALCYQHTNGKYYDIQDWHKQVKIIP